MVIPESHVACTGAGIGHEPAALPPPSAARRSAVVGTREAAASWAEEGVRRAAERFSAVASGPTAAAAAVVATRGRAPTRAFLPAASCWELAPSPPAGEARQSPAGAGAAAAARGESRISQQSCCEPASLLSSLSHLLLFGEYSPIPGRPDIGTRHPSRPRRVCVGCWVRGTQQACGACCVLLGGFVVYMTRRVIKTRRKKSPPGRIRRSPPNLGVFFFFGNPKCPVFFGDNYRKSAFSAIAYGGRA